VFLFQTLHCIALYVQLMVEQSFAKLVTAFECVGQLTDKADPAYVKQVGDRSGLFAVAVSAFVAVSGERCVFGSVRPLVASIASSTACHVLPRFAMPSIHPFIRHHAVPQVEELLKSPNPAVRELAFADKRSDKVTTEMLVRRICGHVRGQLRRDGQVNDVTLMCDAMELLRKVRICFNCV
jgi:hypothetical protein